MLSFSIDMVSSLAVSATALLACSQLALAEPKAVKMSLHRNLYSKPLEKRAPQSVDVGNAAYVGLYYVNASVGTPPQVVQLQIDTGSADVWMFGANLAQTCQQCQGGFCESFSQ